MNTGKEIAVAYCKRLDIIPSGSRIGIIKIIGESGVGLDPSCAVIPGNENAAVSSGDEVAAVYSKRPDTVVKASIFRRSVCL